MKKDIQGIAVMICDKCRNEAKTTEPNPDEIFKRLGFTHHPDAKKLKNLCANCSPKKK